MLISKLGSVPKVCRFSQRNLTVIPGAKNVTESCFNIMEKNLDFLRIHGPTADEVVKDIDLSGKTCLITGANSGIGLEMSRCLNARGCSMMMACRNTYEAGNVLRKVCDRHDLLQFYETNLASLKSVKNTTEVLLKLDRKIDIVILNAAVFGLPWTLTEDGLETTFQVNFLSQYYLLNNIKDILAPNVRVVFISSESHRNIKWPLNTILSPTIETLSLPIHEYTSIKAYNISKLCNLLAMHYLGYCWLNTAKQVFCAHPGSFIKTKLCRNWWVYESLYSALKPFTKSVSQAASTPLYCATSPNLNGLSGLYLKNCERCEASELANDFQLAFRVHDLTCDMVKARADLVAHASENTAHDQKHDVDETLMSNYST